MGQQSNQGVYTMTNEQKFKRKAKQILKKKWPNTPNDIVDGIVNDSWIWFEEHGHQGNMDFKNWKKILKKNGITV